MPRSPRNSSPAPLHAAPKAKPRPSNAPKLGDNAAQAEKFLKAISNSHRLAILCELLGGEKSVASLQAAVDLSQSSLSQHLARLRKDALVKTRRESQTIHYSLADGNVLPVMRLLFDLFCAGKQDKARSETPRGAPSKALRKSRRGARK